MPEPTVCMPADQIAGAITFLAIATGSLAVMHFFDLLLARFPNKKNRK